MEIKLKNLHPVKGTISVKGPQVDFGLSDAGSANVTISLSLSDGTHFFYPDGSGKAMEKSTSLPPGHYECVLVVNAFDLQVFGRSYRSKITVGGTTVASTNGSIPEGESRDGDFQFFGIDVR